MIRRVWSKLVEAASPSLSALQLNDVMGWSATPTSWSSFKLPETPWREPSFAFSLLLDGYSLNIKQHFKKYILLLDNYFITIATNIMIRFRQMSWKRLCFGVSVNLSKPSIYAPKTIFLINRKFKLITTLSYFLSRKRVACSRMFCGQVKHKYTGVQRANS